MKKSHAFFGILLFIIIILLSIILVRTFYCSGLNLRFSSTEFNNIATPVISFFGFIGLIITIWISINQYKNTISEQYFNDLKNQIDKLIPLKIKTSSFEKSDIFNFIIFLIPYYKNLMENKDYVEDLEKFITKSTIEIKVKSYENEQSVLRSYKMHSIILFQNILNLIKEIERHKSLTESHKYLLLDKIINGEVSNYIVGSQMLDMKELDMSNYKDHLYVGFLGNQEEIKTLKFFDEKYFELFNYIMENPNLKKIFRN